MTTVLPELTLTARDVYKLLNDSPFGLLTYGRTVGSNTDAFSFAVHTGIINYTVPPNCRCGIAMRLGRRADRNQNSYQGLQWECGSYSNGRRCRHTSSITVGTFFDDVKLPWVKVLDLCIHWFFKTPVVSAAHQVGVSKGSAIDWYGFCREICYNIIDEMDICIGGQGFHVEIDETHLFQRKYNRGRQLAFSHVWVFGGICRETKEAFEQVVPDRSGRTLWPIIMRKIHPGSIILTDSARVYASLHEASRGGYEHYAVNHRRHFVDPANPNIHTNTVERQWGLLKGMVKGCMNEEKVEMYLGEFIYRRQFFTTLNVVEARTLGKQFDTFLGHMKKLYPGL
ncbi:putative transposase-like protein [Orchesella cincta]|uniref:Putative transposase-like protein n=1 Tax=Orchesella cincta TaxID=48709 RepID=A0A1D2MN14_ORCCI|nr:putative transposase-like protein [Orchesella cincta]